MTSEAFRLDLPPYYSLPLPPARAKAILELTGSLFAIPTLALPVGVDHGDGGRLQTGRRQPISSDFNAGMAGIPGHFTARG